jgi:hypothetical protein
MLWTYSQTLDLVVKSSLLAGSISNKEKTFVTILQGVDFINILRP